MAVILELLHDISDDVGVLVRHHGQRDADIFSQTLAPRAGAENHFSSAKQAVLGLHPLYDPIVGPEMIISLRIIMLDFKGLKSHYIIHQGCSHDSSYKI